MAVPITLPVTIPVLLIVATEPLLMLHTPPAVVSVKVVVALTQTKEVPVIPDTTGSPFTVTTALTVVTQPAPLVTV